jgi:hypothetical protein
MYRNQCLDDEQSSQSAAVCAKRHKELLLLHKDEEAIKICGENPNHLQSNGAPSVSLIDVEEAKEKERNEYASFVARNWLTKIQVGDLIRCSQTWTNNNGEIIVTVLEHATVAYVDKLHPYEEKHVDFMQPRGGQPRVLGTMNLLTSTGGKPRRGHAYIIRGAPPVPTSPLCVPPFLNPLYMQRPIFKQAKMHPFVSVTVDTLVRQVSRCPLHVKMMELEFSTWPKDEEHASIDPLCRICELHPVAKYSLQCAHGQWRFSKLGGHRVMDWYERGLFTHDEITKIKMTLLSPEMMCFTNMPHELVVLIVQFTTLPDDTIEWASAV